ncbi:hypothetical protein NQZ68_014044 [Dissostichus eleginoides]|nr:hypothetical protein NQZ68_014044 [Dissostichus eleginoides]
MWMGAKGQEQRPSHNGRHRAHSYASSLFQHGSYYTLLGPTNPIRAREHCGLLSSAELLIEADGRKLQLNQTLHIP